MDASVIPYLRRVLDKESLSRIEQEISEEALDVADRVMKKLDSAGLRSVGRVEVEAELHRHFRTNRLTQIFNYISENYFSRTIEEARKEVRALDFSKTPEEKEFERQHYADYVFTRLASDQKPLTFKPLFMVSSHLFPSVNLN